MSYIVKRLKDLKTARIDLINIQLQSEIVETVRSRHREAVKRNANKSHVRHLYNQLSEHNREMIELLKRFNGHHLEKFAKALALGKQRK